MELDREKVRQRIDREEGKIKSNGKTSNESSGGVKIGCAAQFIELRKKTESRFTVAKNQRESIQ